MKDSTILWKISQGMYILTTKGAGCCVDSVSQISGGDNPLIAVAVMKKNYTNEAMKKNDIFAISVLGTNIDPEVIRVYGMNSMRNYDKFANSNVEEVKGVNILPNSLGYMICEKVDAFENDTHTVFIGRLIEADNLCDEPIMTYQYYQEHKSELLKIKTEQGKTAWVCTICGYIYYGEEVSDGFICPICGVPKNLFELKK